MDPKEAVMRLYIHKTLYARALECKEGRQEAIRELLGALRPDFSPEAAQAVARAVPPLLPELHRKWIGMFVDKLMETASPAQVEVLCDGSEENGAALALAYVMFLESQRLEQVIAGDLAAVEALGGPDMASTAAGLCAKLSRLEQTLLARRQAKAQRYRQDMASKKTH